MPTLGVSELLVIFMIVLVVFGASRLPALGEGLGRAMRGLKRGMSQDDNIQVESDGAAEPAEPKATQLKAGSTASSKPPAARDAEDAELVDPKA